MMPAINRNLKCLLVIGLYVVLGGGLAQAQNAGQLPNAAIPPGQPAPLAAPGANPLPLVDMSTQQNAARTPQPTMQDFLPLQEPEVKLDPTVRIKDITFIEGDRFNHLSGEGLVFGLSGTGGRSEQTMRIATNYFIRQGMQITRPDTKNMSAVLVSARVPAYTRVGETIQVTVSVADDAASLRGGTLNLTALRGIDDEIYAVAQGPIVGGGVSATGAAASVSVNHPTVGVCEAILEKEIDCGNIVRDGRLRLVLRNKSYSTATVIANALNSAFPEHAWAIDSGTIEVAVPLAFRNEVPAFISMIGDLRVVPDMPARVVVNQKTGTVVLGHEVKLATVVFASENIVIATNETPVASQPNPFSQGQTVILPRTNIGIYGSGGAYNMWNDGLSVGELANALNSLGVSPNTLINVLTSLRTQGALEAELIIE